MTSTAAKISESLRDLRLEYQKPDLAPWIVAFSGGKDSTLLAQLVFEMLLSLAPSDRRRPVHLVNNDTRVESPLLAAHARRVLDQVSRAAAALGLPVDAHVTAPEVDQTFWANLIGRGYMPPNRRFRWCTDRLKVEPTKRFLREKIGAAGSVVLLLGVRRAESANRARTIEDNTVEGERLSPHKKIKNCMVFRPIADLSTEELWQVLLQRRPPWGGSHRDLVTLYRNAQAGECPMVLDQADAPSCGANGGRFGCWTCTVVKEDRSGLAMADAGFEEYADLAEFRGWLRELEDDPSNRQLEKRNFRVTVVDGNLLRGPFTLECRGRILDRLLALQAQLGRELISEDEILAIKRTWAEDVVSMVDHFSKER